MTERRAALAAAVAFVVVAFLQIGAATPVHAAEDVSNAEFRRRADRVMARPDDQAARRALLDVGSVDGRSVDPAAALAGADDRQVRARLRSLSSPAGGGRPVDAVDARADAERILDGRRFNPATTPRPLRGVLRWLGDLLRRVLSPFDPVVDAVAGRRPLQALLAGLVVVAAVAIAIRIVRHRAAVAIAAEGRRGRPGREDPVALERAAEEAERRGDFDTAVRLRFRVGLLRLDRVGALSFRPSLTSGDVVRTVPSPTLPHLTRTFDAVVYGGRHASADDADAARTGWTRVLEEAGRR